MADSKSYFTVDSTVSSRDSSTLLPDDLTIAGSQDSSTLLPDDLKISENRDSYFSRLDMVSSPDFSIAASGDKKMIFGGSTYSVTGGQTVYLMIGTDKTEDNTALALIECTAKQLQVSSTSAPGTGESFVYTIMKNGSADPLLETTVANANKSGGLSDATGISFSNGDEISVRLVTSASAAESRHTFSIKIN